MPYRLTPLADNFVYHVFNRGVEKRQIFLNDRDYNRFLKTLFYYQLVGPKPRFSRFNPNFHKNLNNNKIVEIYAYCFMPNHFHFLIKQVKSNGISEFIAKISNSYTKYFNTKYKRVGPLLQGPFKAVLVESDEQLIHLSRYIHLNPLVSDLVTNLESYSWSSYLDYLSDNDSLLEKSEVLKFFKSTLDYKTFIDEHEDYARSLEMIKHQLIDLEN